MSPSGYKFRVFKWLTGSVVFISAIFLIVLISDINYQADAIWNKLNWNHWLGISCSYLLLLNCLAAYLWLSLKAINVRIKLSGAFSVSVISAFSNYVFVNRSGIGVRAAYLKILHRVNVKVTFLLMLAFTLAHVGLSAAVSVPLIFWTPFISNDISDVILIFLIFLVFISFLGIYFIRGFLLPFLVWDYCSYILLLVVSSVLFFMTGVMQVYFSSHAFEASITLSEILIYSSLRNIAGVVSITPGGLGLQEAFSALIGQAMRFGADVGLAIQLCIRISSISIILFLIPFSYFPIKRELDECNR